MQEIIGDNFKDTTENMPPEIAAVANKILHLQEKIHGLESSLEQEKTKTAENTEEWREELRKERELHKQSIVDVTRKHDKTVKRIIRESEKRIEKKDQEHKETVKGMIDNFQEFLQSEKKSKHKKNRSRDEPKETDSGRSSMDDAHFLHSSHPLTSAPRARSSVSTSGISVSVSRPRTAVPISTGKFFTCAYVHVARPMPTQQFIDKQ